MTFFTHEHLLRLYARAPLAFWRHDIDVSLEAAAKLARFAQLAGVRATFYVMANSEFYNPFSTLGEATLSVVAKCGHRVGMHVDYKSMGEPLGPQPGYPETAIQLAVRRAGRLLGDAYPHLVDTQLVSFHMPPPEVLWRDFDGFTNAYGARWRDHYLSDARREWNDVKEERATGDGDGLGMQIALHAEHWFPMGFWPPAPVSVQLHVPEVVE